MDLAVRGRRGAGWVGCLDGGARRSRDGAVQINDEDLRRVRGGRSERGGCRRRPGPTRSGPARPDLRWGELEAAGSKEGGGGCTRRWSQVLRAAGDAWRARVGEGRGQVAAGLMEARQVAAEDLAGAENEAEVGGGGS